VITADICGRWNGTSGTLRGGDALYWRGVAKRPNGDVAAGDADIAAANKIDPEVGQ
jgi:hypothetical protein